MKVADTLLGVSSVSVAVQVTVVMPTGNVDPDAGVQPTVAGEASPASSTAVGAM